MSAGTAVAIAGGEVHAGATAGLSPPDETRFRYAGIPPRVQPVPTEEVVVDVVVVVTAAVVVTGAVVVSVGTFEQVDALQIIPAGHAFPQIPQLPALDVSS